MTRRLPIGTRCCAPKLPDTLVRRERLDRGFAPGCRHPVTLVSAPPGAGKTTLLASWFTGRYPEPGRDGRGGEAPGREERRAWLSLDHRDDDPRRLAQLVVSALERAGAIAGADAGPGARAVGDVLLDAAFEDLIERGQPCALFVDDLHEVTSADALEVLAHLVERGPALLDLVLASRADPPIGWGRLMLDGRLRQVRNAELRFSEEEAAELLAAHGVQLAADHTRLLWERMEGWAAGLRLAACALQSDVEPGRFVLSTSATQAAVSDYLLKEVLARQDPETQQFLLRSSVADRLTPDLATALTGDERAGERLAGLERRGVFLVELDDDGSYRYHQLFGTLLRARLRLHDTDLLIALHRRAAQWFLDHGLPLEAEEHARAAGDWPLVGRLVLSRWLDATLEGDRLDDGALAGLPPPVVLRAPALALVSAAAACAGDRREEADGLRAAVDRAKAPAVDPRTWRVARAALDAVYGRAFGDGRRARAAVSTLSRAGDPETGGTPARRFGRLRAAELDLDAGQLDRARTTLEDLAAEGSARSLAVEAGALAAVVDATRGVLDPAERGAARALAVHGDDARSPTAGVARLAIALAKVQRGADPGARDIVGTGARDPAPLPHALRPVVRALVAAATGRNVTPSLDRAPAAGSLTDQALVAMGVFEAVDPRGRMVRAGGAGERAVATARRWLRGDAPGPPPGAPERWLDGLGDDRSPSFRSPVHPRTLIEAAVVAALLASARGDDTRSLLWLEVALDRAATSGIRAPFGLHAAQLRPLVERHLGELCELGAASGLAMEVLDRPTGPEGGALVEPLTDREREVLHHLPTLMSNVEIAEGMHLSVNTVKTHLKAVYRKLGVTGRRQAVLRGRELDLF